VFGDLEPEDVEAVASLGFPGIEPYRQWLTRYLGRPAELRRLLDANGIQMITCSNGGAGQSTDFIDPALRAQTMADHLEFAQRFLSEFGCRHFKINLGARPEGGTTDTQLQAIAGALNDLGRDLDGMGIRLAPHPHIWGPVERPEEILRLLELTDPAYVSLTLDTGQVLLGGGDPIAIMEDHWDRIVALHWKDAAPSYRGWTGPTPTRAQHQQEILYKDIGSGGVDFVRVWELQQARDYRYWITLDLDPPRSDEGTVEAKLQRNVRYLRDGLGISRF
jgi:inosose dehydratase